MYKDSVLIYEYPYRDSQELNWRTRLSQKKEIEVKYLYKDIHILILQQRKCFVNTFFVNLFYCMNYTNSTKPTNPE